jgi:hypothetical protein
MIKELCLTKTNGRIESMTSLPPNVQWVYDHHPEVGSEEEKLVSIRKSNELEFRLIVSVSDDSVVKLYQLIKV